VKDWQNAGGQLSRARWVAVESYPPQKNHNQQAAPCMGSYDGGRREGENLLRERGQRGKKGRKRKGRQGPRVLKIKDQHGMEMAC